MKKTPVYRRVGGSNCHPPTLRFEIVAWALVDDWWYDRLMAMGRWMYRKNLSGTEYARLQETGVSTKNLFMHQVVGGKGWDHKDGNGLNNQESNLRPATRSQQAVNQRLNRNSISGEPGVSRDSNYWRVTIYKDRRKVFRRSFKDKDEAIRVAREKRKEIHGPEWVRER